MKIELNKMFVLRECYQTLPSLSRAVGTFLAVSGVSLSAVNAWGRTVLLAATSNEVFAVEESKEASRTD